MRRLGYLAVLWSGWITMNAAAQTPAELSRPYDGIQAGLDAFRMAEDQRQADVTQQLGLNDMMRFYNGYATSRGATIYYGYLNPAIAQGYGYAPLASLDAVYGYGYRRPWYLLPGGVNGASMFEPWLYVPGDVWGYGAYYPAARQSVGQRQSQTGPNRWESHPVYDPPLTMHRPLPGVDSAWLDRTPYAAPIESPVPAESAPPQDWVPPVPPKVIVPQETVSPGPVSPTTTRKRREY